VAGTAGHRGAFARPRIATVVLWKTPMHRATTDRRGLTLMELLVVLAILVALGTILIPLMGNVNQSTELDSTFATMSRLRDAIMGTQDHPGYFQDMKNLPIVPTYNNWTSSPGSWAGAGMTGDPDLNTGLPFRTNDLSYNPGVQPFYGTVVFNPATRKGWRGPYITQPTSPGGLNLGTPSNPVYVLDSFPTPTGSPGSPIIIQWPDPSDTTAVPRSNFVRLLSLGANGVGDNSYVVNGMNYYYPWNPQSITPKMYNDDLILYVRRDVPGMDWTNYTVLKGRLK